MQKLIDRIKEKSVLIPTNTKENRAVRGAYVDCIQMVNSHNSYVTSKLTLLFNHLEHMDDEIGSEMVEDIMSAY